MVAQNMSRRQTRVSEAIRSELSLLLLRTVDDPRLAWVTITDVEVSADLRNARAYYVVTAGGGDPERVQNSLQKAAAFLQGAIGRNLKLKYAPNLTFILDKSFDNAARIDRIIHEVQQDRGSTEPLCPEDQLAELLSKASRILVFTHRNPDGDAVGSLLGFSRMLRLMGKSVTPYCPDGIPRVLAFLSEGEAVTATLDEEDLPFDLTVCLDTADEKLFPPGLPAREQMGTLVVIDHHVIHGSVGDVVIRREISSVGELLFYLHKELVWPMDKKVAECLYTSIVADTGSFRYSNTTPETHRAAAALVATGARSWMVATALFESYPVARQRILATVLQTLEMAGDDRYASLFCTPEMLAEVDAGKEDLDNVINFARAIDTVKVAAMFRVEPSGDVKLSFRSKGSFDVAQLASRFGGGGHKNAAGGSLKQTSLEDARKQVGDAILETLAQPSTSDND